MIRASWGDGTCLGRYQDDVLSGTCDPVSSVHGACTDARMEEAVLIARQVWPASQGFPLVMSLTLL